MRFLYDVVFVFIMIFAIALCLSIIISIATGCTKINIDPVTPEPMIDCDKADDRLRELDCYGRFPIPGPDEIPATKDDASWLAYCVAVQESGIILIDTDCIVASITCDEIEDCL